MVLFCNHSPQGTQVYDAKKGSFVDIGILDVLQIFGRAGRPQFDNQGEGIIITAHDKLSHYLSLLTRQSPIESQFISSLTDSLNAEVRRWWRVSQKNVFWNKARGGKTMLSVEGKVISSKRRIHLQRAGKTVQTNKFEARERSYYWKGREKQCRAQKKTSACILLLQNRYLVGSAGTWSTSSEIEHLTCISLCLNCLEMFFINPFT